MRILLCFLFFCLPFGLFAQKDKVEFVVSPFQPFLKTTILKTNFKGKGGLTLGAHYLRNVYKNLWFVTGLEFLVQKNQDVCDCSTLPSEHDGNGGYLRDASLDDVTTLKQIGFQIPLLLRFSFPNKKLKPFVQGGLVQYSDLYYNKTMASPVSSLAITETGFLKRNLIGGRLASGINFPLTEKSILSFSIFGQYSKNFFNNFQASTEDKFNFLQLGLEVGYQF
jgi:hypothetical protein